MLFRRVRKRQWPFGAATAVIALVVATGATSEESHPSVTKSPLLTKFSTILDRRLGQFDGYSWGSGGGDGDDGSSAENGVDEGYAFDGSFTPNQQTAESSYAHGGSSYYAGADSSYAEGGASYYGDGDLSGYGRYGDDPSSYNDYSNYGDSSSYGGSSNQPHHPSRTHATVPLKPAIFLLLVVWASSMLFTAYQFHANPEGAFANGCHCLWKTTISLYRCQLGEIRPIACAEDDEDYTDEELARMQLRPGIERALQVEHGRVLRKTEIELRGKPPRTSEKENVLVLSSTVAKEKKPKKKKKKAKRQTEGGVKYVG